MSSFPLKRTLTQWKRVKNNTCDANDIIEQFLQNRDQIPAIPNEDLDEILGNHKDEINIIQREVK